MGLVLGIDDWAGNVIHDYCPMVAAGVKYACIRMTNGTLTDQLFEQHYEESLRAGLVVKLYSVWYPAINTDAQIEAARAAIPTDFKGQLDWDIEVAFKQKNPDGTIENYSNAALLDKSSYLVGAARKAIKIKQGAYSGQWWWNPHMSPYPSWQLDLEWWLASYPFPRGYTFKGTWAQMLATMVPFTTGKWALPIGAGKILSAARMWQWSGDAFISTEGDITNQQGVPNAIDLNLVDQEWLDQFPKPGSTYTPGTDIPKEKTMYSDKPRLGWMDKDSGLQPTAEQISSNEGILIKAGEGLPGKLYEMNPDFATQLGNVYNAGRSPWAYLELDPFYCMERDINKTENWPDWDHDSQAQAFDAALCMISASTGTHIPRRFDGVILGLSSLTNGATVLTSNWLLELFLKYWPRIVWDRFKKPVYTILHADWILKYYNRQDDKGLFEWLYKLTQQNAVAFYGWKDGLVKTLTNGYPPEGSEPPMDDIGTSYWGAWLYSGDPVSILVNMSKPDFKTSCHYVEGTVVTPPVVDTSLKDLLQQLVLGQAAMADQMSKNQSLLDQVVSKVQ